MKALVLDGSREGDDLTPAAVLGMTSALAGRVDLVELVKPRELDIAPCAGCFGYGVGSYVGSDLVVFVSPVTFGGYSSQLKKLLDRIILSVLDPRFTVVGGEVHHRLRYRRYPKTVGFGTLPSPDPDAERLFARLVARNGINVHQQVGAEILTGVTDPVTARRSAERLLDWAHATLDVHLGRQLGMAHATAEKQGAATIDLQALFTGIIPSHALCPKGAAGSMP